MKCIMLNDRKKQFTKSLSSSMGLITLCNVAPLCQTSILHFKYSVTENQLKNQKNSYSEAVSTFKTICVWAIHK